MPSGICSGVSGVSRFDLKSTARNPLRLHHEPVDPALQPLAGLARKRRGNLDLGKRAGGEDETELRGLEDGTRFGEQQAGFAMIRRKKLRAEPVPFRGRRPGQGFEQEMNRIAAGLRGRLILFAEKGRARRQGVRPPETRG